MHFGKWYRCCCCSSSDPDAAQAETYQSVVHWKFCNQVVSTTLRWQQARNWAIAYEVDFIALDQAANTLQPTRRFSRCLRASSSTSEQRLPLCTAQIEAQFVDARSESQFLCAARSNAHCRCTSCHSVLERHEQCRRRWSGLMC